MSPTAIAAVAAGGALGAVARFLVAVWIRPAPGTIPWATLSVNVAGSLVLAGLAALTLSGRPLQGPAALLVGTGFCGALTTFSTFSVEAVALARAGHVGVAATYVALNLVACFAVTWLAFALIAGRTP